MDLLARNQYIRTTRKGSSPCRVGENGYRHGTSSRSTLSKALDRASTLSCVFAVVEPFQTGWKPVVSGLFSPAQRDPGVWLFSCAPDIGRAEASLTGPHQSPHPVRRASKVQEGRISPALVQALSVYDTAEKVGWSTCISLTRGKRPKPRAVRSAPGQACSLLAFTVVDSEQQAGVPRYRTPAHRSGCAIGLSVERQLGFRKFVNARKGTNTRAS